MNPERYLIVDDDENFCRILARALARRNIAADSCHSAAAALAALQQQDYSRAIVDLKIAQDSGLNLIKALLQLNPQLPIVMLTGYASISTAVEAIKFGAANYLCKPASVDDILQAFALGSSVPVAAPPEHPPSLDRMEWEIIQKALLANQGNISATARELGMHRRTLQRKLLKRPSINPGI